MFIVGDNGFGVCYIQKENANQVLTNIKGHLKLVDYWVCWLLLVSKLVIAMTGRSWIKKGDSKLIGLVLVIKVLILVRLHS